MLDSLIFQKTDLGKLELTSRTLGLSSALRLVLVLVDGRRDVARLAGLSDAVRANHSCLEELLNAGFIEVIGESLDEQSYGMDVMAAANRTGQRPVVQVPVNWSTSKPMPEPEPPRAPPLRLVQPDPAQLGNFQSAKNLLINALQTHLGSEGNLSSQRVQQAQSTDDLLMMLAKLTDLIGLYATKPVGDRLYSAVVETLAR